jgi:hypothetical protein
MSEWSKLRKGMGHVFIVKKFIEIKDIEKSIRLRKKIIK